MPETLPFEKGDWVIDENRPGRPGIFTGRIQQQGHFVLAEIEYGPGDRRFRPMVYLQPAPCEQGLAIADRIGKSHGPGSWQPNIPSCTAGGAPLMRMAQGAPRLKPICAVSWRLTRTIRWPCITKTRHSLLSKRKTSLKRCYSLRPWVPVMDRSRRQRRASPGDIGVGPR